MANMQDFARAAAMGGGGGGGMPPADMAGMEAAMEPPAAEELGGGDEIEGAIASIESAFEAASPDIAEKAREHLTAIRELASQLSADQEPPALEAPAEGEAPVAPTEE